MSETRARQLRKRSTDAERKLWLLLKNRRLGAYKFRRQVPLGNYIVDFLCYEKKLIVEVDGGQHNSNVEYDMQRDAWLKKNGFKTIRFWNNQVLLNSDEVQLEILKHLEEYPHPDPLP